MTAPSEVERSCMARMGAVWNGTEYEEKRVEMTNEQTRALIAEARQEESIQDKLGDGFGEGSEERAFYYEHRDRYKRLADALEAATRERDAAVARVRAIHYSAQAGVEICGVCLVPFPCSTIAALDGAPEPEDVWEYGTAHADDPQAVDMGYSLEGAQRRVAQWNASDPERKGIVMRAPRRVWEPLPVGGESA